MSYGNSAEYRTQSPGGRLPTKAYFAILVALAGDAFTTDNRVRSSLHPLWRKGAEDRDDTEFSFQPTR